MDLTQSSDTSQHQTNRRAQQSDQLEPINSTTYALGLRQDKLLLPIQSQTELNPPVLRIREQNRPAVEPGTSAFNPKVENNYQSETTTKVTPLAKEEVTPSTALVKHDSVSYVTTSLPETTDSKKIGLKSARSLPEEQIRPRPGTIEPGKESDGVQSPHGVQTLEALPFTSPETGLAQWSDMQKRSSVPLPAFDVNKWLEAVRAQYRIDKKSVPNPVPDPSRNPFPFSSGIDTTQNQFLVVNNRGVVIPNSVQFPEVVKSATYPQLQTYRYPQTSRNIQDILRYVTGNANNTPVNRMRQTQWPTTVKKAAKLSGMYFAPTDNYAASTYLASRPEAAYMAASLVNTPTGGKHLNGHAYISDPFHPYKPADPTEINHLADNNPGYIDSDFPNNYIYPTQSTKLSHSRGHFGGNKQPQPTPYTTAIFKPFGNPDQIATSTANVDSTMQYLSQHQKRVMSPLSVMLEIYPMSNDDSRTVPFRGTATSNFFRSPGNSVSLQKEPSVRRPVALAVDASVASSQTVNVPVVTAPLQFQPQAQPQPAFGMTLAGLPPIPGMSNSQSKHRMVVHLNFYPKKNTVPVVPRLRDPTEDLQTTLHGQADTPTTAVFSDYLQRRQSAVNRSKQPKNEENVSLEHATTDNYFPGSSVVQAEFDASSLASILPKEVVQRFSDFLRGTSPPNSNQQSSYEVREAGRDYDPDVSEGREDHMVADSQYIEDDDSEEEDEDEEEDDEEGRVVPYPEELFRANLRRHPPMMRFPETARVPFHRLWRSGGNVSWSDFQYDDENDEEEIGEIKERTVGEASPKMKIMHGKTSVIGVRDKVNELAKTPTTEKPKDHKEPQHKPRRRIIIEASPKNHRMN